MIVPVLTTEPAPAKVAFDQAVLPESESASAVVQRGPVVERQSPGDRRGGRQGQVGIGDNQPARGRQAVDRVATRIDRDRDPCHVDRHIVTRAGDPPGAPVAAEVPVAAGGRGPIHGRQEPSLLECLDQGPMRLRMCRPDRRRWLRFCWITAVNLATLSDFGYLAKAPRPTGAMTSSFTLPTSP